MKSQYHTAKIKEHINAICTKYPDLSTGGFCATPETIGTGYDALLDDAENIAFVAEWLSSVDKIKKITKRCGNSRRLRHSVEPFTPHKSLNHGSFIIGAIIAGFDFKRTHDGTGTDAYFNISANSLQRKMGKKLSIESGHTCHSTYAGI
jgi:hypothetical protein